MRYWVYINDKVEGPFEEDKLVTLPGFTPDTLICAEEIAAGGSQEWVKASSIFEFDQVEQTVNQPLPAAEVFQTQSPTQPVPQESTAITTANLLLEKMDLLTREISGLQNKLDEMQNKLDAAITSVQNHSGFQGDIPAYIPPQEDAHNTITLTRQALETVQEENHLPNTEHLVSQAEDIVNTANQEEKPLDMLGPIEFGEEKKQDATPTEVTLGSKAEEEVVLRSALDSLYNAKAVQSQEEKESTFQDLLTPKQAEALAAQAEVLRAQKEATSKPTLDDALKAAAEPAKETSETAEKETSAGNLPSEEEAAKDALLKELTAEPKEDILDQVIKEREEEQKAETFKMEQAAATGAAIAAEQILQEKTSAPKQPAETETPGFETVQEAAAEPVEEKQTLDFTQAQQEPPLTIAPDRAEPEKQEQVHPASQMPADQPAEEQKPETQPAQAEAAKSDLPSLEESVPNPAAGIMSEEAKEETMQELVPGAKSEKPDGIVITDADLNEAFAEHNKESDQSVEQLFGIASPSAQSAQPAPEQPLQNDETAHLPQFSDQTVDKPLPVGNPDDLTEIELKEGSTYLISDFVPPAQANANALPKELEAMQTQKSGQKNNNAAHSSTENTASEIQEMVSPVSQNEKQPEQPAEGALKDVTISQVILENTIKTKRGATLDIKTVPMVPEPAQSERLHLDTMNDDINAQHDMKEADLKTPAKTTKMLMGIGATVVLAALIYFMLAFMNLIPAQFNVLSSGQKTAAPQNAQIADEMLPQEQPAAQPGTVPMEAAAANPMDNILTEVKNYPLQNGYTLQQFIEAKHPAAQNLITWEISTAVDPDNYSVLVKVPPENPQSFKISYRFNYNTVTKALDPTISDAKNLLDSVAQSMGALPQGQMQLPQQQGLPQQPAMPQQPMRQ